MSRPEEPEAQACARIAVLRAEACHAYCAMRAQFRDQLVWDGDQRRHKGDCFHGVIPVPGKGVIGCPRNSSILSRSMACSEVFVLIRSALVGKGLAMATLPTSRRISEAMRWAGLREWRITMSGERHCATPLGSQSVILRVLGASDLNASQTRTVSQQRRNHHGQL